MNKYHKLIETLAKTGEGVMKCFGNSMLPILSNPSTNHYRAQASYAVDDIVFCKVKGRFIDAHKITKVGADGRYMISNNHGHDNGWTRTIYGRVVKTVDASGLEKSFGEQRATHSADIVLAVLPPNIPKPHIGTSDDGDVGLTWYEAEDRFSVLIDSEYVTWVSKEAGAYLPGDSVEHKDVAKVVDALKTFFSI